jgi:pimeloyl-ACP methyl ester carboxylesterase
MQPRRFPQALLLLVLSLSPGGCASLPGARETTVAGSGSPVIVLETGLGADLSTWRAMFPAAAEISTVFAYSRPGYGGSEAADTRRTGRVVVEELRAVLRERALPPPYVLVGHSLGGLYMQLFARTHPDEVAGLVLVDSTHPTEWEGPTAIENQPACTRFLLSLYMTGTRGREFATAGETGQDVLRAPALAGKPVVVLAASRGRTAGAGGCFIDDKRRDLAVLFPGSQLTCVVSGHGIHKEQPQAVVAAIRLVFEALRAREKPAVR